MNKVTARPSFQGDLMICRIDAIPTTATRVEAAGHSHILAHSETGHHHVVEAGAAHRFIDETNAFISYLSVMSETELRHLRDFDTHEAHVLEPGNYVVHTQREYIPEGWRRAAD